MTVSDRASSRRMKARRTSSTRVADREATSQRLHSNTIGMWRWPSRFQPMSPRTSLERDRRAGCRCRPGRLGPVKRFLAETEITEARWRGRKGTRPQGAAIFDPWREARAPCRPECRPQPAHRSEACPQRPPPAECPRGQRRRLARAFAPARGHGSRKRRASMWRGSPVMLRHCLGVR